MSSVEVLLVYESKGLHNNSFNRINNRDRTGHRTDIKMFSATVLNTASFSMLRHILLVASAVAIATAVPADPKAAAAILIAKMTLEEKVGPKEVPSFSSYLTPRMNL